MTTTIPVEQITGPVAEHGEGPVWLGGQSGICWVDQLAGDVLCLGPSGDIRRTSVGPVAAVVRPRSDGGLVFATERNLVLDDGDRKAFRALPAAFTDGSLRFNDGGCDPEGRLYVGTTAYDGRDGAATLYRFDADHSCSVVLEGVSVSNGLAWTPDGRRAYYVDSPTQQIDCFDYEPNGELTGRRPFVRVRDQDGIPDGLTVDVEGGVWLALWGGSAVHRYAPSGELDAVVTLPVDQVTACAFGGDDLGDLYVTTSSHGLAAGEQPESGSLFRCRPGVAGLPVTAYAG